MFEAGLTKKRGYREDRVAAGGNEYAATGHGTSSSLNSRLDIEAKHENY